MEPVQKGEGVSDARDGSLAFRLDALAISPDESVLVRSVSGARSMSAWISGASLCSAPGKRRWPGRVVVRALSPGQSDGWRSAVDCGSGVETWSHEAVATDRAEGRPNILVDFTAELVSTLPGHMRTASNQIRPEEAGESNRPYTVARFLEPGRNHQPGVGKFGRPPLR